MWPILAAREREDSWRKRTRKEPHRASRCIIEHPFIVYQRGENCVWLSTHSRLGRWKTWYYRSRTLLSACSIFLLLFKHTLRHIAALVQLSIKVTQISAAAAQRPKAALRMQPSSWYTFISPERAHSPTRPKASRNIPKLFSHSSYPQWYKTIWETVTI